MNERDYVIPFMAMWMQVRKAKSEKVVDYILQRAIIGQEPSPVKARLVNLGNRKVHHLYYLLQERRPEYNSPVTIFALSLK